MPIGSANGLAEARRPGSLLRRWFRVAYARLYGASDLHTHIRWRAIRRVVPDVETLLDVGSGDGIITLEIARQHPATTVRGVELEAATLAQAERARAAAGLDNLTFAVGDAVKLELGTFDAALLLDILEHVRDDGALVEHVGQAVKPGGCLVISTPTPNFPRVFGNEFHDAIGHLRDGYWPEDVADLIKPAGFVVDSATYYTRLPSTLVCSLYYRYLWRNKGGLLLSPVLNALSMLDATWPSHRRACSILVVATKLDPV